jgi:23S rRNA (guanine745-N1)-methyltransferase
VLICPVRNCLRELQRGEKSLRCAAGHSFDVARSGYINLLQPQDRRSKNPGDTLAAVTGRCCLHDRGVAEPFLRAIAAFTNPTTTDTLLDAGCGDGYYAGRLARETGCEAHGVDISLPAIEAAARRYPECEWVVANADRFLPFADRTFSLVLSITARMNAREFRRVLKDGGRLLIAVPSPDDLVELRGPGRDRAARTVEEFAGQFRLVEQRRVTSTIDLDAAGVEDVLHSIYRPLRSEPARAMRLTFGLDLLLFTAAH